MSSKYYITPQIGKFIYFFKKYGIIKSLGAICFSLIKKIKSINIQLEKNYQTKIKNKVFYLMPNDKGISYELKLFKTHEPVTSKLISQYLKNGMHCIDIGSNIGYFVSLESNIVGNSGKIYAIEPSPITLNYLEKNIKNLQFDNAEIYSFVCGDVDGVASFLISDRSNWCRVMTSNIVEQLYDDKDTIIKLPMKRLDTFVTEQNIQQIDFIRMDVEGFEIKVIDGMNLLLQKFHPIIQIEVHPFIIGKKNLISMISNLKNFDYDEAHILPRELDMPFIGSINDVKKIPLSELIEKISLGNIPNVFQLLLL